MATSWAFEMETLILSWYVLVETQSVLLLTVFASLQYTGTLLGPMMGVIGDRVGHRHLLCGMRAAYMTLATALMVFTFTGVLTPVHVFAIAALMGLVRPSDIGMRAAVVGAIMPAPQLMAAMGIQRTTQDSARIAGALTGAGLMAALGMGPAYIVVALLYATSFTLTWIAGDGSAAPHGGERATRASPWRDLKAGLAYVWNTPLLFSLMCLAFMLNMTAFPMLTGLLPYVAKEIYAVGQPGLGYMVASVIRPARITIIACVAWYAILLVFSQVQNPSIGIVLLMLAGYSQSISQVPMAAILLQNSDPRLRGRVMGIRMLAIYGNVPGLLISGPLIASFGYAVTGVVFCVVGLAVTLLITTRWRAHLWRRIAPGNVP
jgi:MFS family permease